MPSGGGQQSRRLSGSFSKGQCGFGRAESSIESAWGPRQGRLSRCSSSVGRASCLASRVVSWSVTSATTSSGRGRIQASLATTASVDWPRPSVATENLGVWVAMMRTPQVVPHCLHVRRALRLSDLREILEGGDLAEEVLWPRSQSPRGAGVGVKGGSNKVTLPTMDDFLREVKILAVSMTGAVLGGCFFAAFEDRGPAGGPRRGPDGMRQ